jgi:hypothetical protein
MSENQLAVIQDQGSALLDPQMFSQFKEISKMLATSTMVPKHFQGASNVGNCMIALETAHRLKTPVFMLMQKMYIVSGKVGYEATFVIAMINKSGLFSPLRWRFEGEGNDLTCYCYATDLSTKKKAEAKCSVALAKAEGWWSKSGSKWPTMTEQMLQYRSAAFFGRLYAPDVIMGMHTADELQDVNGQVEKAIKVDFEEVADDMEKPDPVPEKETVKIEDKDDPVITVTKNDKEVERPGQKKDTEPEQEKDVFADVKSDLIKRYQSIRSNLPISPGQNKKIQDHIVNIESQEDVDLTTMKIICLEQTVTAYELLAIDEDSAKAHVKEILSGNLDLEGLSTLSAALQQMIAEVEKEAVNSGNVNQEGEQQTLGKDLL